MSRYNTMKGVIIMRKVIVFLAVCMLLITGACAACADTLARDAMITYTGTDAFTKLTSMERQACVNWLVHGGTMDEKCSKAVMKLVSRAPDAVTAEQRQALIAEASGIDDTVTASGTSTAQTESEPPQISKKDDDTGKIIAIGLLGVLAGLIIHNNVGNHKSAPSYRPAPPRPAPHYDRRPPQNVKLPPRQPANRPPQNVSRPPQKIPQRPVTGRPAQDRKPPRK